MSVQRSTDGYNAEVRRFTSLTARPDTTTRCGFDANHGILQFGSRNPFANGTTFKGPGAQVAYYGAVNYYRHHSYMDFGLHKNSSIFSYSRSHHHHTDHGFENGLDTMNIRSLGSGNASAEEVVGSVAGGALAGAKLGSVIPGVGTAIGAVAGGVFGGLKKLFHF